MKFHTRVAKRCVVSENRVLAPKVKVTNRFSNKSDMWSFGVLLWEIYSFGRVPYPRTPLTDVMKFIDSGGRMKEPNDCPAGIYQLMKEDINTKCGCDVHDTHHLKYLKAWLEYPDDRPNFTDAYRRLKDIQLQTPV